MSTEKKSRPDIRKQKSDKTGFAGFLENTFRKAPIFAHIYAFVPIIIAYILSVTISLTPAFIILECAFSNYTDFHFVIRAFIISLSFVAAYGCFAALLIITVPFFNFIYPAKLKPFRGNWLSLDNMAWYYENALTQLVRYTVLDFFQTTPVMNIFYRLMGMKIGKNVIINTTNISDPSMITLGDNVTIGGSATIFAHYAQDGYMVIAPTVIENKVTVGLKASIMGDVTIKEGVTVPPHEIVLPKTIYSKEGPSRRKQS